MNTQASSKCHLYLTQKDPLHLSELSDQRTCSKEEDLEDQMSDEPLNPKASFWGGARESGVDNLFENPSLAQPSLRFPPKTRVLSSQKRIML